MSCKTILPTNIDEVINALDLLGCERLTDIKEQIKKVEDFNNVLKIDEEFLSLMVDEYQAGMFKEFEPDARSLIYFAQRNYPKLGTLSAIKKVFEALDIEAEIKEWFKTGKEPFTFDLDLSLTNKEITPELIEKLKKLIEFTKNIRSKLDELILSYKTSANLNLQVGNMGESAGNAEMITGFTNTAVGFAYPYVGTMSEAVAVAEMTEV
jgi:P2-related tail formation protein